MEFRHIMLDIETMGNQSYSSIVSIGAVKFDIESGKIGETFCVNVDLQSCIDLGLIINADTVIWWMKQSQDALKKLKENPVPIMDALALFSDFCSNDYQIWGNSASFDCGILKNAYDKAMLPAPWSFWNERDVRTLVSFNPEIKGNYKNKGVAHNAIDDCLFQIGYCCEIWKCLNK